jgi:seryl-tRNA synthetase
MLYPLTSLFREGKEALTEVTDLRIRIEKATKDIAENYAKALKNVGKLKEKMSLLEAQVGNNNGVEAKCSDSLNSAIQSLDKLTDSQILRSKKAWKKYKNLEHDCKQHGLDLSQFGELRASCEKTEKLAADLLCYSMGHLRQRESQSLIL